MARLITLVVIFLIISASLSSCLEGRKLLQSAEKKRKKVSTGSTSSRDSLFFSALPKGTVPSPGPGKRGHATIFDEKLIARNLIRVDPILPSVPSPGVGH